MSMISALIDELRHMADGQATYRDARAVMLQAADTIWELRDELQRANAENERLRRCMESHDEWGEGFRAGCDAVNAVNDEALEHYKSENAKLHELIVRCCDCESAREHYEGMDVWWCEHLQRYVGSDGFCCWGIRRDYEEGK